MAISYLAMTLLVPLVDDHAANTAGDDARAVFCWRDDAHDDIDAAVGAAWQVVEGFDGQSLSRDEFDCWPAVERFKQPRELVAMKADAALARAGRLLDRLLPFQEVEDGGGV